MSTSYNLEPPPTAKVLLQTTSGDIELELFAKQTPLASRNFLQLCLDGYYNGTIFHRIVPGFVLQGGDPTGTGDGGDSIYPEGPFADEFHSRLKFNRRGLLGMANSGRKDDNGSQFFLTLGKTEELNNRNTMFGRVVGDTIYNVVKMGETELVDVPGSERPLYPTKITGAEILVNPFDDMVKRDLKPKVVAATEKERAKKKPKKKAGKAFLSFAGGDGDDAGEEPAFKKTKFNTRIVEADPSHSEPEQVGKSKATIDQSAKHTTRKLSWSPTPPARTPQEPKAQLPLPNEEVPSRSPSTSPEPERFTSKLDKTNAEIAKLKESMKRTTAPAAVETKRKKSALEELIPDHAIRGRKRKQGNRDLGTSDSASMSLLDAFRAKLEGSTAKNTTSDTNGGVKDSRNIDGQADENADEEANLCDLHFIANCQSCKSWDKGEDAGADDDDDDKGWMSHALNFEKDRLGKDLSWKKKNEEDLVVIDPREKAAKLKGEQKPRKDDRKSSRRAWDVDRDRGKLPERPAGR